MHAVRNSQHGFRSQVARVHLKPPSVTLQPSRRTWAVEFEVTCVIPGLHEPAIPAVSFTFDVHLSRPSNFDTQTHLLPVQHIASARATSIHHPFQAA